jgi:7-cyano-7-deazaguanine synthase
LAIAQSVGFECHALSFDYGQRHRIELMLARKQAELQQAASHGTALLDLREFGGSALTAEIDVPKNADAAAIGDGIPITYVPARNTIFLSFALAKSESMGATDIFMGVNALDYSGYPDCRPEFIQAFEALANLATKAGIEGARYDIHVPLIKLTKAEIILRGVALGVDYGYTSSCYDPSPNGEPCLHCDSCLLRLKGFAEAGLKDPLLTRFGL